MRLLTDGSVGRKLDSSNPWLNLTRDLCCHFKFTSLRFLGVYFNNTLASPDVFLCLEFRLTLG